MIGSIVLAERSLVGTHFRRDCCTFGRTWTSDTSGTAGRYRIGQAGTTSR